ncbi:MAG: hypothetical protein JW991_02505 [Candidatus Pacebacteria bacterium]|nr:hypothetical protein [Candidatus Paceibacterota bacterium]
MVDFPEARIVLAERRGMRRLVHDNRAEMVVLITLKDLAWRHRQWCLIVFFWAEALSESKETGLSDLDDTFCVKKPFKHSRFFFK